MKIKTPMRYHLTPFRIANIEKTRNNKCWQWCWEKGTLLHCWWECKLVQPLWEAVWRLLKKSKIEISCDPAIVLPGTYQKKTKSLIQKDICTPMFIAALFTIAKIWKQPKGPSVNKWIKRRWCTQTMEYYSAIKKKEILPFETTWMYLECINAKWNKPGRKR